MFGTSNVDLRTKMTKMMGPSTYVVVISDDFHVRMKSGNLEICATISKELEPGLETSEKQK